MVDANSWLQPKVTWIWTDMSLLEPEGHLVNWAAEDESETATHSGCQPLNRATSKRVFCCVREWRMMDTLGWLCNLTESSGRSSKSVST